MTSNIHFVHVCRTCLKCGGCVLECEHRTKFTTTTTATDQPLISPMTPNKSDSGELYRKLERLEIGTYDQDKGDQILHRYIASHSINAIVAIIANHIKNEKQNMDDLRKQLEAAFHNQTEIVSCNKMADLVMPIVTAHIQVVGEEDYLSHFSYIDWEVGDDDKLRVGDKINCNHQRPHDGYERNFEGEIVLHHANNIPVIIYNVDPKEPDNSGEYADLQSLMMDGWEFSRLAQYLGEKDV